MTNMTPTSTPTPSLKPERIGLVRSPAHHVPLKPERIGLRLQKLPGWELLSEGEATAVWRGFRFQRSETAQAFAAFAAHLARDHGQRPVIAQSWNAVTVTLPGDGAVTESDLDFAERLMLLPVEMGEKEPQPAPESVANTEAPAAVAS